MCAHVCIREQIYWSFSPSSTIASPCENHVFTEGHHSEGVKVSCTSEVRAFASSGPFRYYINPPDQMISALQQKVCRLFVYRRLISLIQKDSQSRVYTCTMLEYPRAGSLLRGSRH